MLQSHLHAFSTLLEVSCVSFFFSVLSLFPLVVAIFPDGRGVFLGIAANFKDGGMLLFSNTFFHHLSKLLLKLLMLKQ